MPRMKRKHVEIDAVAPSRVSPTSSPASTPIPLDPLNSDHQQDNVWQDADEDAPASTPDVGLNDKEPAAKRVKQTGRVRSQPRSHVLLSKCMLIDNIRSTLWSYLLTTAMS